MLWVQFLKPDRQPPSASRPLALRDHEKSSQDFASTHPRLLRGNAAEQLRNGLRWKSHQCEPIATTIQVSFA